MILDEMLKLLDAGEVVCRKSWSLRDGYLVFLPGTTHIWKIVILDQINAGNYIFSKDDLEANDWKIFEVPKEALIIVSEEPVAA